MPGNSYMLLCYDKGLRDIQASKFGRPGVLGDLPQVKGEWVRVWTWTWMGNKQQTKDVSRKQQQEQKVGSAPGGGDFVTVAFSYSGSWMEALRTRTKHTIPQGTNTACPPRPVLIYSFHTPFPRHHHHPAST